MANPRFNEPRRARLGLIEASSRGVKRHRSDGIRGARASASLKQCAGGSRRVIGHGLRTASRGIRGARASASLKRQLQRPVPSELRHRHPRRARLGLIEAMRRDSSSASPRSAHPRRARLGLIEASASTRQLATVASGIRGARASASLKHATAARLAQSRRHGIRGARASASLKLGAVQRRRRSSDGASEARAPRPH